MPRILKPPIVFDRSNHPRVESRRLPAHPDVLCLSHLRWDFVFQRPQHLMTRCARDRRVFFVEEPVAAASDAYLQVRQEPSGVWIVVPHLPGAPVASDVESNTRVLQRLISHFLDVMASRDYVTWYLTPMAMAWTRHLTPCATVYDCMDELSLFAHAPADMKAHEAELLARADLVFTGGWSLFEAKKDRHPHVHAFPSSVDVAHFARARTHREEPRDQQLIPHPRVGYVGVIDERMDFALVEGVARARPDWQMVFVGPLAKVTPAMLPSGPNIHYLGRRDYDALPAYIAGWDVAMMPFAHNDATRFISPTKTPEYLAAGRAVVSTSVRDVVTPYGELGLVRIADTVEDFVRAAEMLMQEPASERVARADAYLAGQSWDATWQAMRRLLDEVTGHVEADEALSANASRQSHSAMQAAAHGHDL